MLGLEQVLESSAQQVDALMHTWTVLAGPGPVDAARRDDDCDGVLCDTGLARPQVDSYIRTGDAGLLHAGLSHSATAPIPKGKGPCANFHAEDPVFGRLGEDEDFNAAAFAANTVPEDTDNENGGHRW